MNLNNGKNIKNRNLNKEWVESCSYEYKGYICTDGYCLYKYEETCSMTYNHDSVFDDGSGSSGGGGDTLEDPILSGGGGSTSTTTSPIDEEEEDKIDDSELKGKEKCLNELLDKKGDSYVKNLLSNFQGNDSEFDITISSIDQIIRDDISKTGLTQEPINGVINIIISSSEASSRPALGVARTLLHEYIHADMFRKLNTKYRTSEDLDFKKTYESFKNGNFKASPQHETMAELYIHEMTSSLQAFHINVLTGDYNYLTDNGMNPLPINFYEALAWQGLKEAGVAAYNELSPEKRTELQNALEMYYSATTTSCPNP